MEYDPFEWLSVEASERLIVFGLRDLQFALPIAAVQKVVRRPAVLGSGLTSVGVAHIDDSEITVLDIHHRLFQAPWNSSQEGFLLLIQGPEDEIFGLPVDQMPTMIDVPVTAFRPLPASFRRSDTFGLAYRVAVLDHEGESLSIFVLDFEELLALFDPRKLLQA